MTAYTQEWETINKGIKARQLKESGSGSGLMAGALCTSNEIVELGTEHVPGGGAKFLV